MDPLAVLHRLRLILIRTSHLYRQNTRGNKQKTPRTTEYKVNQKKGELNHSGSTNSSRPQEQHKPPLADGHERLSVRSHGPDTCLFCSPQIHLFNFTSQSTRLQSIKNIWGLVH